MGAGVLRQRVQAGVDAIEKGRFVFADLPRETALHELIATATASAAASTSAAGSRQRRQPAHALALVIAARIGADLGVGAAEQRIVRRGIDRSQLHRRGRGLRGWGRSLWRLGGRRARSAAPASSARATRSAKVRAEVEFFRLPGTQALADLFGVHRRVAGGAVAFAGQDGGGFVGAVAAAALNVHGHDHIGAERADQADVVADDFLAAPFFDDFLRIEGVAVVNGAGEVLFGAIGAVRGKQLGGAEDTHVTEQFGPDLVLAAVAAVVLQVHRAQAHAVSEEREHGVGLVVGVCGGLHEGSGNGEFAERQAERDVAAILRHERKRHARLRQHVDKAALGKREAQNGSAGGKNEYTSHGWNPREDLGVVYRIPDCQSWRWQRSVYCIRRLPMRPDRGWGR